MCAKWTSTFVCAISMMHKLKLISKSKGAVNKNGLQLHSALSQPLRLKVS